MFDRQSIHVAMLLWGCIFNLLAALCMFMSRNFDKEKRKWMLFMELSTAVLLCSDAFAWAYRGYPGKIGFVMVRIANFTVFAFSDIVLLFFHKYMCICVFRNEKNIHRIKWVTIICIISVGLVVLSQFTHLYYDFDENNFYYRNKACWMSMFVPMLGMLIDLSLLLQYRKKISGQILISMLSYIVLPFGAVIIQTFYYGASLINIAICISMIFMFVVAMVEQNKNLAKKVREAAELRNSLMLSQIAPHFIYNTLTAIRYLCETDPKMAREMVDDFAGYLRGNIDFLSEKDMIPFDSELKHVRYYLAIEKKRFADRVNIKYDIQDEDFLLPPLTLQPIVENAVKHGLCKKSGGGTVEIRTERKAQTVYITVTDDGAGFDLMRIQNDGEHHVGLTNVEARVKSICKGSLKVESTVGRGTIVVISLPQ